MRKGFGARLPEVSDRLLPDLTAEGVVSQGLDLLVQPIGVERFDGLHDPGMEGTPAVMEHAGVRHFVGEGVLERVFEIREDVRLVKELGRLQAGESAVNGFLRYTGDE